MRIMHIITRLIIGGAQENTVLSCEGQHDRGHAVMLATGPETGPEGSLLPRARDGGYRLACLPAMRRAIHPWADAWAFHEIRTLIAAFRPDVVHTHSSKAGVIGRAAAWHARVPAVIHTIHGLPYHPYQSRLKNALYVYSEKSAARKCHRIACVADAMRRQALAAGVGRESQYTVVYSGMETDAYLQGPDDRDQTRRSLGIAPDEVVVGTVARLFELKGHDDLLDVLPALLERHPRLRLLWVGDGSRRDRLERRMAELGVSDRVVLAGLVNPEQVPRHLRAMDLLAHPSYREGLPRAVVQGMLAGLPVVAYDCDGAPEVCVEGETGMLVPTGDVAALGEALLWMLDHPERGRAMGRAARARCAEQFSAETMVEALDRLYRRTLADRGCRADGRAADEPARSRA